MKMWEKGQKVGAVVLLADDILATPPSSLSASSPIGSALSTTVNTYTGVAKTLVELPEGGTPNTNAIFEIMCGCGGTSSSR